MRLSVGSSVPERYWMTDKEEKRDRLFYKMLECVKRSGS